MSYEATLKRMEGTWKQESIENESEFFKAVGLGKTKRMLLKKIKIKVKIEVKSATEWSVTEKAIFNNTENHKLDQPQEFNSALGKTKQIKSFIENEVIDGHPVLKTVVTLIEPAGFLGKLKAGDEMVFKSWVDKDGFLHGWQSFGEVSCHRVFKNKKGGEAKQEEDQDDVENIKLMKEVQSAKDD